MKTTAELKIELDVAFAALRAAENAKREARKAYGVAACADKMAEFEAMGGIVGVTRVREVTRWGSTSSPIMTRGPFLVVGAIYEYSEVRFILRKIKKDGTASANGSITVTRVTILPEDQPK